MSTSSRRGFTLVELLIVIAIIGLLMGLMLPAVQAARERARMAQCNTNLSELGKAMMGYSLKSDGAFPGWASEEKTVSGGALVVPWTFKLLSRLEESTLREQILNGELGDRLAAPPLVSIFNCPSDANTNPTIGTLTYIVNSGMPDRTGTLPSSMANSDLAANGVCHDQRSGRKGPKVSSIKDGAAKTLLLSENIHKDPQVPPDGGLTSSWLGPIQPTPFTPPNPNPAAFAAARATNATMGLNPEQRFGMIWVYDQDNPFQPDPDELFWPINKDDEERTEAYTNLGSRFARPASAHPEVFIVTFCGGNTDEISEAIDYRVYQQLMTPDGQKAAHPNTPDDLIELDARFMTPPLSENDY